MCFLVFAYQAHPRYRLILAANRDEFFDRPTARATFWTDAPELLAGRDLKGGGTWMGVTRSGRFAALTNYREPASQNEDAPSRGVLTTNFLRGDDHPLTYLRRLALSDERFNGFNLLIADNEVLFYYSNRQGEIRELGPGVYGLSNHLLDTPWPKVQRGKEALDLLLAKEAIEPVDLLALLEDSTLATDNDLPNTGVGMDWERALSPIFIATSSYGTRSSTALLVEWNGKVHFVERTFSLSGEEAPALAHYVFHTSPASR